LSGAASSSAFLAYTLEAANAFLDLLAEQKPEKLEGPQCAGIGD
jgi:hypothetical protein